MSNGSNEPHTYDPLDRTTFDALAYNAIGRASEIGTYPALGLTHSSGNSGWSVGIVQWDFGQPGRGDKVDDLIAGYQAWARAEVRFTAQEVESLANRLRTRGQTGNALAEQERSRLNEYLRSNPGREFVSSLNQEQIDRKWANVGEPLSRIEWLRELRASDPAQAAVIVAQAMKLYNQNEARGERLIAHLQNNASTADETREWIGTDGVHGLTATARAAIVSGRDNAVAGARLMNALEQGEGRLSQAWRQQVHDECNPSLYVGFSTDPDVQLLDAMLRNPPAGSIILGYIENGNPPSHAVVRGINRDAALEMSRVELSREGELTVTSPNGDELRMTHEGWNRDGTPMQGRQPGREIDEPDHMEGIWRSRALTPDHARHPDHALLEQIRAHVRKLDERAGKVYDSSSERFSRSLLAASKDNRDMYPGRTGMPLSSNAMERVDHVVTGSDGRYAFAVQGDLHDPAHKRAHVDIVQARQTPVEQSDTKLEAANQQIARELHLALRQERQHERNRMTSNPVMHV